MHAFYGTVANISLLQADADVSSESADASECAGLI